MLGGNIQQFVILEDVYFQFVNGFVFGFVGSLNKIEGSVIFGGVWFGSGVVIVVNVGFIEGVLVCVMIW